MAPPISGMSTFDQSRFVIHPTELSQSQNSLRGWPQVSDSFKVEIGQAVVKNCQKTFFPGTTETFSGAAEVFPGLAELGVPLEGIPMAPPSSGMSMFD